MLEVRHLSFAYRHAPVLRDVSFVVSPGEIVSVIGANGAGKTTLLKILATLVVPSGGCVLSDGTNAFERPMSYRHQLGYLPEKPALYDDMTVRTYLSHRAALKGEAAKRMRRRVSEAVELCQLEALFQTPIARLSAGERKRVALADAVLLRPRVLLLDDFLAGLDASFRSMAGSVLSAAAAFSSVIITGHELSDFVHWTTRFVILKNGIASSVVPAAGGDPQELEARLRALLAGGAS